MDPIIPKNYDRLTVVDRFNDLATESFGPANVILYPRTLTGNFNGLAQRLNHFFWRKSSGGCIYLNIENMENVADNLFFMEVSDEAEIVLQDMKNVAALKNGKVHPLLRVIDDGNEHARFFENVYKFHDDGNVIGFERFFGCYNEPVTEWLRNEDAIDNNDGTFSPASDDTPIYTFSPGNIWRHAGKGSDYPPFIHRAVPVKKGAPPRLILEAS